jgi:hypothetical protein
MSVQVLTAAADQLLSLPSLMNQGAKRARAAETRDDGAYHPRRSVFEDPVHYFLTVRSL